MVSSPSRSTTSSSGSCSPSISRKPSASTGMHSMSTAFAPLVASSAMSSQAKTSEAPESFR